MVEKPSAQDNVRTWSDEGTLISAASAVSTATNGSAYQKTNSFAKLASREFRNEPYQATRILLANMLQFLTDEELQLKALVSLIRMASNDEQREIVGESGCLEAAMAAMRSFPNNEHIMSRGFMLLANSAYRSDQNKAKIREEGGIDILLVSIEQNVENEKLVSYGCLALRNLTSSSTANQMEACSRGAAPVFASIMQHYPWSKKILTHVICSIGHIASGDLQCQRILREGGCISDILLLMRKHISQAVFVEHCAVTIANLCIHNEINQRTISKLGGVQLLSDAFQEHAFNYHIYVRLYEALRFLCLEEYACNQVAEVGILKNMISDLHAVSKSEGASGVAMTLQALSTAVSNMEESKKLMTRSGGVEKVMNVLEEYPDELNVLNIGLRLFRNISDRGGTNCQLMAVSGVFSFILGRMEAFPENEDVLEHCFVLLFDATVNGYDEDIMDVAILDVKMAVETRMRALQLHGRAQSVGTNLVQLLEEQSKPKEDMRFKKKLSFQIMLSKVGKSFSSTRL